VPIININLKNKPLPDVKWIRPNNVTHGITVVTVNKINGPIPIDAIVYYASTLDNTRYIYILVFLSLIRLNDYLFRRDFRLARADPNDNSKFIVNPVIWLTDSKIIKTQVTKTAIIYTVEFQKPLSGWFGFFINLAFSGLDNSVLEISSEVNIIPETFPYPDCFGKSCHGSLV
jgi:hypothetical protein